MGNIYTISELAELLSVTRPVVEKKLKRMGNNTPIVWTSKDVNFRAVKAVKLTLDQEKLLGIDTSINIDTISNESTVNSSENAIKQDYSQSELIDKILEYSNSYNTRIESYIERAINAEQKVKFIEDKQRTAEQDSEFYKNKFFELQQENSNLISERDILKTQIDNQNNEITSLKQKNDKLMNDNRALSAQIAKLNEQLEAEQNKPIWKKKLF